MPFLGEPFDPTHIRCKFADEGRRFSEVMDQTGKRPPEIARAVGISVEQVRGYRRGFARPGKVTKRALEQFFGMSLDPQAAQVATAPASVTLPATVTVVRDPSGDLLMSVRLQPEPLARFLAA